MDFAQCLSILQARAQAGPPAVPTSSLLPEQLLPQSVSESSSSDVDEDLSNYSVMDLVRRFHECQAERIQTYTYFDGQLEEIIVGNYPARYPHICSEATQKFAKLSGAINRVKTALEERGQKELATCIVRVQAAEKEKLTLVAAHHLDRLKSTVLLGSEHITGSKTEAQEKYLAEQIAACQERIGEATEELQCCLCEME